MFIHDVRIVHESVRMLAMRKPQYVCMEQDSGCYKAPFMILRIIQWQYEKVFDIAL